MMVFAQLVAFGRVSQFREKDRERRRGKERAAVNHIKTMNGDAGNGKSGKDPPNGHGWHMNGGQELKKLSIVHEEAYFG